MNSAATARTRLMVDRVALITLIATLGWLAKSLFFQDEPAGFKLLLPLFLASGALAAFLARGPVLFFELIRTARRGRLYLLRWLYVVGLFLLLLWVHEIWLLSENRSFGGTKKPDYRQMASLAETYFYSFAATQFLVLSLLTPAIVAGTVAEEKERRTLDYLLATDLNSREILFGKLAAKLGTLGLFVIAGLPILSLMQVLGGIEPGLLLASFVATGITVLSLSAISLSFSTARRRARDAIAMTYGVIFGYLALTALISLFRGFFGLAGLINSKWVELSWVVDAIQAGNPIYGFFEISRAIATNSSLYSTIWEVLKSYAAFHTVVVIACVTWSALRLRPIANSQAGGGSSSQISRNALKRGRRRALGRQAMLWKELWFETKTRLGWISRILVALLLAGAILPLALIFLSFSDQNQLMWDAPLQFLVGIPSAVGSAVTNILARPQQFQQGINIWLRVVNACLGSLMLVNVAVRASTSIGNERDRDTLTTLLTTPLSVQEILLAKWIGSIAGARSYLWLLVPVWLIGLVTGSVSPAAAVLMVFAWLTAAAFFSAWGLWCSTACATTTRASTWGLLGSLFFGAGHWTCLGTICYLPLSFAADTLVTRDSMSVLFGIQAGLTPPAAYAILPFQSLEDLATGASILSVPQIGIICFFVYWVMTFFALAASSTRFAALANRQQQVPILKPAGGNP